MNNKCNKCGKVFSSKQCYNYHVRRNVCEKVVIKTTKCSKCNKVFSTKQMLEYHIKKKVCLKYKMELVCDICDKEFTSKQSLDYHNEHGVCMKGTCVYCGTSLASSQSEIDYDWHQMRCNVLYKFQDIICYDHGDLVRRCCPKETIKRLVLRKKAIDQRFYGFDEIEGRPWEDQVYWQSDCKYCGCKRDEQHIWQCLAVKEAPKSFKEYMDVISKWRMSSGKEQRYQKRFE